MTFKKSSKNDVQVFVKNFACSCIACQCLRCTNWRQLIDIGCPAIDSNSSYQTQLRRCFPTLSLEDGKRAISKNILFLNSRKRIQKSSNQAKMKHRLSESKLVILSVVYLCQNPLQLSSCQVTLYSVIFLFIQCIEI